MNKIVAKMLTLLVFIVLICNINVIAESEFSPKLQEKLSSAVLLHIGQSKAYVNNGQINVESTDSDVCPFIKDGRTLVPVRFISESFGANVKWNDSLKEVTVNHKNNNIRLIIGSKKIYVNDTEKEIDVPAQIVNERTFLPLRALVEALGKNVFWDDRGIIVISDNENMFDEANDMDLIDEIERIFENIKLEKAFSFMADESISFLQLGISDKEVINKIGQPDEKSEAVVWGADGREHQSWSYTKDGIALDMIRNDDDNGQAVNMVTVFSPCSYKTKRNIGIGSTRDEVINIYKNEINNSESSDESIVLGSIYGGVILDFENDKVSSIFIGASAE